MIAAQALFFIPKELITDKKRGTIRRNNVQYFHFRKMSCENNG